ncbi:MAG: hypothetical protein MJ041_00380 [Acidaminococcaceae bacterium]|nr:hypothetical protein [Acidaminococcaceae bacterium]
MSKILSINIADELVTVAMDNGLAKDLPLECFNFEPEVGKEVEIHKKDDGSYVVNAVEQELTKKLWFGWVASFFCLPIGMYFLYKAKHMKSYYFFLVVAILSIVGALIE